MTRFLMRTLWHNTPLRDLIYAALLERPAQTWNVQTLIAALPGRRRRFVSPHVVRATLLLLFDHQLAELVYGRKIVTLRLTDKGTHELATIVAAWRECRIGASS